LGPNSAARASAEAGLGVSAGGVALSGCGGPGPGVSPRKIFENSDAKSCILVAFALINGLPRPKGWGLIHCWSPKPKSLNQSKSVPTVVAPMVVAVCDGKLEALGLELGYSNAAWVRIL